jgi:hypothetical protein
MAKIQHISKQTIRTLAGIVDFYYWRGIPVARSWPVMRVKERSPAVLAAAAAFKASRADLRLMSSEVRAAWRTLGRGKKAAWLDVYTGSYLKVWKTNKILPPVVTGFSVAIS